VSDQPVSVEIAAPAELVFRLAHDPLRWSVLLPHYSRSELVSRGADGSVLASFVARRMVIGPLGLGVPVAWRSRSRTDPVTRQLHFRHVDGATDGMEATWQIEATEGGCRVTIEHVYPAGGPVPAALIDRFFARPIASQTLATFRALAEALAQEPVQAPAESNDASVTKVSV
jgi:ribosome-associated toxin RatA of RatAB toxin-antitoxin module